MSLVHIRASLFEDWLYLYRSKELASILIESYHIESVIEVTVTIDYTYHRSVIRYVVVACLLIASLLVELYV